MTNRVVISGCSGGGKSTLLAELETLGYGAVKEPGRRIIAEERQTGGDALPWANASRFLTRAIAMSLNDIDNNPAADQFVFFDRGLIDAASAMSEISGKPIETFLGAEQHYHQNVFLTPPWPEIYETDADRKHKLDQALEEYNRLLKVYPSLGYEVFILPKTTVGERAKFVLEQLANPLSDQVREEH